MAEDGVRLNKFIAEAGVASRRAADRLIEEGKIDVSDVKGKWEHTLWTIVADPYHLESRPMLVMMRGVLFEGSSLTTFAASARPVMAIMSEQNMSAAFFTQV